MSDNTNAKQYHLKFHSHRAKDVDAYLEYKRIVGDDDEGQPFSPEEYEEYKKEVLPTRIKNRLYVSWISKNGMDCKLIGPETPCFCAHRFRQHKTDLTAVPTARPINIECGVSGCKCKAYHYVPLNGSQPIRCTCKHTTEDHHNVPPYVCKKFPNTCMKCRGFYSCFTCGCGEPAHSHVTLVGTGEEREVRGHPVGQATPYQAMGGVTGFSSLIDGYMRLDPSGKGAPDREFLEQPITANDDPFLRGHVRDIKAHQIAKATAGLSPDNPVFDDQGERTSAMRRHKETDMEYFERRYQEKKRLNKK